MRFVSFNINGLRAHLHQLKDITIMLQPDIIGLQETKVHNDMFPFREILSYGYHSYCYGQKGYYGVALITRIKPITIRRGFLTDGIDTQRRIIMADFMTPKGVLTVINAYFPQGERRDHPIKFPAKQYFYRNVQNYVKHNYHSNSLLLVMGDMNISPTDLDIGIGKESQKRWLRTGKCAFLSEEREWMDHLLKLGLVDIYRQIHPIGNNRYSWFDYRSCGFNKNRGLRIDLLLASQLLAELAQDSDIDYAIRAMDKPSDHAPVWADFDL